MPIYKYKEGDHSGGFIGLRVAVMVDNKRMQKYFSLIVNGFRVSVAEEKRIEEKAMQLEGSWKYQQQSSIIKRHNEAKEQVSSVYSTGVRGIRMKFIISKKMRSGELRAYYTPVFIVSGSNNNKKFGKSFNIITQGYQSAWTYAVLYYAINKNLTEPSNLLQRLPPVEKFMVIIKEMHKSGHKVPKRRLPVELWNNNQVRAALGNMA
jgi:hypothetical protein